MGDPDTLENGVNVVEVARAYTLGTRGKGEVFLFQ